MKTQPTAPSQTCSVSGGGGTIVGGGVMTVAVNCELDTFTVGGTVTGLAGTGLVLQNEGGSHVVVNANGTFAFAAPIPVGTSYAVSVLSQPTEPSQTCTVTNGSGTMATSDVTEIAVACTTDTYAIGGTVSGLTGSGLSLQNNGGDDLAVSGDEFVFATRVASGEAYAVTVKTDPTGPAQTCTVTNGEGTVGGAPVSVSGTCALSTSAIGGTVAGLSAGESVVLRNNDGDEQMVSDNGPFTFGTRLLSGATYAVTVLTEPADKLCVVKDGSGSVDEGAVTDVEVVCAPCGSRGGAPLVKANGTGVAGARYCYEADDSVEVRARKACESLFGVGECCVIPGGYDGQQYGKCGASGRPRNRALPLGQPRRRPLRPAVRHGRRPLAGLVR